MPKFIVPVAVKVSGLTTEARTSTGTVTLTGAATEGAAAPSAISDSVSLRIEGPLNGSDRG